MRFLGIDPGQKGGLALLTQDGEIIDLKAMPEPYEFINFLHSIPGMEKELFVCLEKAQSMPAQGVVSVATYMHGAGVLEGILLTLKIPYELIRPKSWTKEMHIGATMSSHPKQRSWQIAKRLFPGEDLRDPLVVCPTNRRGKSYHDGIVDALLIAEFSRRKYLGKLQGAA